MTQAGVLVVESQRPEPNLGCLRAHPQVLGGDASHSLDHRRVEHLAMSPQDGLRGRRPHTSHLVGGVQAHCPCQPAQTWLVVGKEVGTTQPEHLHPMFHHSLQSVRLLETFGRTSGDITASGQRAQGRQSGSYPQRLVLASVNQLQQLGGEFDVSQPPGTQLDLTALLLGGDVADDPGSHSAGFRDEALRLSHLPHHG